MIKRIKTWFSNYREKRRRKQALEIIKSAKQAFLNGSSPFMCNCFYIVEPTFQYCYYNIIDKIPEFKPSTFGLHVGDVKGGWWVLSDRQSRINAFDKLIEIYSK